MNDIRLSPHFKLREFTFSETAARLGREIETDDAIIKDLRRLAMDVMEPIRSHLDNRIITITSGYRPLWLNQRIGGSTKSDHMYGRAADFVVEGFSPYEVCTALQSLLPIIPVKQLIFEFGRWTHASICAEGEEPRRETLTAKSTSQGTVYLPGLAP